jgi:hypothetical protein
MRRKRAFPRVRTSPLCPRPCHVLSLESNGEFPVTRTVGVDDQAGELVVARRLAARSACAVGAFLYGGMPGGKDAERPGASGASEPAGAKPPRGGALDSGYRERGSC